MVACILQCYANHCATSIDTKQSSEQYLFVSADVHLLAAGVLRPMPAPVCSRRQPWNPSRRRARPGLWSPSPESPFGFEEEQHNWLPQQQITVWGKGTSLHFVLIFLAPPQRQPARAMNSHDRRPGPSPSLGSSVAQAGRAVKQGFELGLGQFCK